MHVLLFIHVLWLSALFSALALSANADASVQNRPESRLPAQQPRFAHLSMISLAPPPLPTDRVVPRTHGDQNKSRMHSLIANGADPVSRFPTPRLSQKEISASAVRPGQNSILIVRGDTSRKEIALTFDDGPHPPLTLRLLALLRHPNVL